jgi:hypothetical protein
MNKPILSAILLTPTSKKHCHRLKHGQKTMGKMLKLSLMTKFHSNLTLETLMVLISLALLETKKDVDLVTPWLSLKPWNHDSK